VLILSHQFTRQAAMFWDSLPITMLSIIWESQPDLVVRYAPILHPDFSAQLFHNFAFSTMSGQSAFFKGLELDGLSTHSLKAE
jgi:hypothetical protein